MHVYEKWTDVPVHLKTKTSLSRLGLYSPGKEKAIIKTKYGDYSLYDVNEALSKVKFNSNLTIDEKNKEEFLIVGTSYTGIGTSDEICQMVVLNLDGKLLFSNYFKPKASVTEDYQQKFQINKFYLRQMPEWNERWEELSKIISNKILIMADGKTEKRLLMQTCKKYGVKFDENMVCLFSQQPQTPVKSGFSNLFKKEPISFINPFKEAFITLDLLYPNSKLFKLQNLAQNYFTKLCDYKIKQGDRSAYDNGYKWLQKEFNLSVDELDFKQMELDTCSNIVSSLEVPLRGLGLL